LAGSYEDHPRFTSWPETHPRSREPSLHVYTEIDHHFTFEEWIPDSQALDPFAKFISLVAQNIVIAVWVSLNPRIVSEELKNRKRIKKVCFVSIVTMSARSMYMISL